jgi:hypothetical protein
MITGEQLLEAVSTYNQAIWPMQIIGYVLALITVVLAFKRTVWASRIKFSVLAFFWLWVALMYWLPSAGPAFPIGYVFLVLYIIEGVLFLLQAIKGKLTFGTYNKTHTIGGLTMILYAMIGYPLLAIILGHPYPQASLIGLTPCPLTLYTFGLLLLTRSAVPIILLIIPLFWGLSGVLWISIGMWEDVGMVLGSLIAVALILIRNKKLKTEEKLKDQDTSSEAWSLNIEA